MNVGRIIVANRLVADFTKETEKVRNQPNKVEQNGGEMGEGGRLKRTSPQAKRHKPSLLFTSLTILTFITR